MSQYPDNFKFDAVESIALEPLKTRVKGTQIFVPPHIDNIPLLDTAKKYPSKKLQIVESVKNHAGETIVTIAYQVGKDVKKTFTLSPGNWDTIIKDWQLLGKLRTKIVILERQAEKVGMNAYEVWKRYLDLANSQKTKFHKLEKKIIDTINEMDVKFIS